MQENKEITDKLNIYIMSIFLEEDPTKTVSLEKMRRKYSYWKCGKKEICISDEMRAAKIEQIDCRAVHLLYTRMACFSERMRDDLFKTCTCQKYRCWVQMEILGQSWTSERKGSAIQNSDENKILHPKCNYFLIFFTQDGYIGSRTDLVRTKGQ